MMIERQRFAIEHIHIVKPCVFHWILPGNSLHALAGVHVKIVHEAALGICRSLIWSSWSGLLMGTASSAIFSLSAAEISLFMAFSFVVTQHDDRSVVVLASLTLFYDFKSWHCNVIKRVNSGFFGIWKKRGGALKE